jgi:hypothetical protein
MLRVENETVMAARIDLHGRRKEGERCGRTTILELEIHPKSRVGREEMAKITPI